MKELEEIKLVIKPIADCELWQIRDRLSDFVKGNWYLLWVGAHRISAFDDRSDESLYTYERDYWAGQRIQMGNTRLCENKGLKYADGHKYSSDESPCEYQLREVIEQLQYLIDCANTKKPAPFKLIIEEVE